MQEVGFISEGHLNKLTSRMDKRRVKDAMEVMEKSEILRKVEKDNGTGRPVIFYGVNAFSEG